MRSKLIIHPFLLPVSAVLFLFSHNAAEAHFMDTLAPTAVLLCLTALLLLVVTMIVKDYRRACIVVSVFMLFLLSYGHIYNPLYEWGIARNRYLLPIWATLLVISITLVFRTKRDLGHLTIILNRFAIIVCVLSLPNIILVGVPKKIHLSSPERLDFKNLASSPKADIYYIILDRYASLGTMQKSYLHDNSEFYRKLRGLGFFVAEDSKANYLGSAHSLSSSLNMKYLNEANEQIETDSSDWRPIHGLLDDYAVQRFLKANGYEYLHFGSWYTPTSTNRNADVNYNFNVLSEFSLNFLISTMVYQFGLRYDLWNPRRIQWRRIRKQFDLLAAVPEIEKPTFVFAHLLIPHAPYVFDRNGRYVSEQEAIQRGDLPMYVETVMHLNKKILELVWVVLAKSATPPVIVLQSDEGEYLGGGNMFQRNYWRKRSSSEMKARMKIFNAYYVSPNARKKLYPSISPVNTFRLIFREYFDSKVPMLPDKSFAYADKKHPYDIFSVAEKLQSLQGD